MNFPSMMARKGEGADKEQSIPEHGFGFPVETEGDNQSCARRVDR